MKFIGRESELRALRREFAASRAVGAIVAGHGEAVYDHAVAGGMSEFMGSAFESICLDYSSKHLDEILGVPRDR